jgi:hypothetical protein
VGCGILTSVWSESLWGGWGGLGRVNVRVDYGSWTVGLGGLVPGSLQVRLLCDWEEVNGTCRLIGIEWLWWDASAPWRRTRRWTRGSSLMLLQAIRSCLEIKGFFMYRVYSFQMTKAQGPDESSGGPFEGLPVDLGRGSCCGSGRWHATVTSGDLPGLCEEAPGHGRPHWKANGQSFVLVIVII